jgi:signal transduction histidine kinase
LTVILGTSELLRESARGLDPKDVAEMAAAISKAAQRLRRMIENYLLYVDLELERHGQGKGPTALTGRSGKDIVARCAHEAALERGRAEDLDLEVADTTIPVAQPLAGKVVYELVDNALKFSATGTRVRVSFGASGEAVTLTVTDHGRGMTTEEVSRIGAFHQFNRSVFEQQGSGLGLALVMGLVEASHGRVGISGTPGGGTTVQAKWPTTLLSAVAD